MSERQRSTDTRDFARYFSLDVARDFSLKFSREVALDFSRDFARYFSLDFAQYFAGDSALQVALDVALQVTLSFSRDIAPNVARYFTQDITQDFSRNFALGVAREYARDFAQDFARDVALKSFGFESRNFVGSEKHATDLGFFEIASLARVATTRAVLANGHPTAGTEHHLVSLAARLSYGRTDALGAFDDALASWRGDPLWPAYARHIARRSTPEDRALLRSLAADPSQREEPLASALKYYVRGDLVMLDGSELTLDKLCDEAGVARLPLLEDMPPELDVNFDAR